MNKDIPATGVSSEENSFTGKYFTWESRDGLTLSGCQWLPDTPAPPSRPAVLCLAGLSRNTRDFNDIAEFLRIKGYHVVALDYRGRGKSDWDPNWQNYAIPVEGHDIDDAITKLQLDRFVVLGTSRGGLHAMGMVERFGPEQFCGVILNDIGPHLEMQGIRRIALSIGRTMTYPSYEALADNLTHTIGRQFPSFSDDDWLKLAHQIASDSDGQCLVDYDPALGHAFAAWDDSTPLPDVWHLYEVMAQIPVLILHGEHSDILNAETCQLMQDRHPNAEFVTIPGEGHAPVLWDNLSQNAIADFLERLSA